MNLLLRPRTVAAPAPSVRSAPVIVSRGSMFGGNNRRRVQPSDPSSELTHVPRGTR